MDGELYEDTEGGGSDQHIFGVGGALCDLSNCFRVRGLSTDDRTWCTSFGGGDSNIYFLSFLVEFGYFLVGVVASGMSSCAAVRIL